jgi:hypothetical protein
MQVPKTLGIKYSLYQFVFTRLLHVDINVLTKIHLDSVIKIRQSLKKIFKDQHVS